jgi:hypothetical protein
MKRDITDEEAGRQVDGMLRSIAVGMISDPRTIRVHRGTQKGSNHPKPS